MTIFFTPEAEEDLVGIVEFLIGRNPLAASKLGGRVFDVLDRLAAGDFEGPEVVLTAGELVRSWPVPPVRVYYRRRDDAIWVLRIYHQARAPIAR